MKKYLLLLTMLLVGAGCERLQAPVADVPASNDANKGVFIGVDISDMATIKTVDKFKVTFGSKQEKITSGEEARVYFQVEAKDSAPIEHVSRYADGFGRLIVQKADTGESVQVTLPPKSLTSVYNRIPFNVTFPAPGKYKLSFEFKYGKQVYTAPFVVEVGK